MIARWMLASIAFTLLCGIAALATERILQTLRRPSRLAWAFALAVGVSWPLFAPWLLTPQPVGLPSTGSILLGAPTAAPMLPAPPVFATDWLDRAEPLLIGGWALASLLLLVQLGVAVQRLARVQATATPQEIDGEQVLVDPQLGPAVIGLLRPRIVIPEWLLQFDQSLRSLVLRHEREHCRAQDPRLVWLAVIATTAMPWNAALWWLSRRMRLAMEFDCDARTLASAEDPARYAKLLLLIAQRTSSGRFVPMLFDSHSQLARRISAMQRTPARHPALRAAAAGVVALAAVTAACSTRIASNLTSPSANVSDTPASVGTTEAEKPMREFKLDTNAYLLPTSPLPRYPESLRGSGKTGFVFAQFIVNSDGSADPTSFRIVRADRGEQSDDAFVAAVRAGITALTFEPAKVEGRKVRQLVSITFNFGERGTWTTQLSPRPAAAKEAGARFEVVPDKIYFDFQVERPVVMAPGSMGPKYPEELRAQKVEGSVLAQYVVDTDGRADMSTFKVLKSSDARFADAVRDALSVMQFSAAEIGGLKVRQLAQQPFQFSIPD